MNSDSNFTHNSGPEFGYADMAALLLADARFDWIRGHAKQSESCAVSVEPYDMDGERIGVVVTCLAFGHVEGRFEGLPVFVGLADSESFDRVGFVGKHGHVTIRNLPRAKHRIWTSALSGHLTFEQKPPTEPDSRRLVRMRGEPQQDPEESATQATEIVERVAFGGASLFVGRLAETDGLTRLRFESSNPGLYGATVHWAYATDSGDVLAGGLSKMLPPRRLRSEPALSPLAHHPPNSQVLRASWKGELPRTTGRLVFGIDQGENPT